MSIYDFHGNPIVSPTVNNVPDDGAFNTLLFKRAIFIGDSLTIGHGCSDRARESYPTRFGEITNWPITNAGVSGYSASTWLAEKYDSYTYTDYDVAFIELGANNGLTDTLDVDVAPYENYADYADTQTGDYCRLIKKLQEDNPKLYVVLVISPSLIPSVSQWHPAADVIIKIGEFYDLPVIDLRNIPEDLMASKYRSTPGTNDDHQNSVGYLAKARAVYKRFCEIVVERADEIWEMFFSD